MLILLAATVLAIYKPAGMTRYGARKQRELGDATVGVALEPAATMRRWVEVCGAVGAAVIVVLLVIMVIFGGHGPGAHG